MLLSSLIYCIVQCLLLCVYRTHRCMYIQNKCMDGCMDLEITTQYYICLPQFLHEFNWLLWREGHTQTKYIHSMATWKSKSPSNLSHKLSRKCGHTHIDAKCPPYYLACNMLITIESHQHTTHYILNTAFESSNKITLLPNSAAPHGTNLHRINGCEI